MDKYLEAIEKETEKEKLLNTKKCEIIESNKRRENLDKDYQKREDRVKKSLEKEKKRKHYLQIGRAHV